MANKFKKLLRGLLIIDSYAPPTVSVLDNHISVPLVNVYDAGDVAKLEALGWEVRPMACLFDTDKEEV